MVFLNQCIIPIEIISLISTVITIIKFGVPIILIIVGMIDLGKAVVASKEDEIKKAQMMLLRKAISAVLVFFVISLVMWLMAIIGAEDSTVCVKCVANPEVCEIDDSSTDNSGNSGSSSQGAANDERQAGVNSNTWPYSRADNTIQW